YAFIEGDDPGKAETARELLDSTKPIVSIQVVNEVCVNLLRRAAFTEEQVRETVAAFFEKYDVVELTQSVLLKASELRSRYSLSYWDSLIVAASLAAGVSVLYSGDRQHGLLVDGQVEIVNPFQESTGASHVIVVQ
ncbi:MAG: PIN domain-containing protein, partial [Planctomycetaceae bacterium]